MDRELRTPPELEGVDWHDDAPRRPRPIVTLVAWIAILGLVLSVGAGIFSAFWRVTAGRRPTRPGLSARRRPRSARSRPHGGTG